MSDSASVATDWTLVSGPGNGFGGPSGGDTVIESSGTIVTGPDSSLHGITIVAGGTAGAVAAVAFSTDYPSAATLDNPTLDQATVIKTAVPGATTPETTVLNASGALVNEGAILANGPAGSTLTINVQGTVSYGSVVPGYFFNAGTIEATAGNSIVINIGGTSALFNTGTVIARGGTVRLNYAANAIAGGDMPVRGFYDIEGGGTIETGAGFPASDGNNGTHEEYDFVDSTAGNTLKIDNIGSFGGVILGFGVGDTIDLGTSLAVGTVVYNAATGLLTLE